MRVSDAALELLDTVLAQSGSLGECLLRQPGSEPVLSKQVAENQGCGHYVVQCRRSKRLA